ncbi:exported hypothetical protein [Pseudomonas serboccidentalis]
MPGLLCKVAAAASPAAAALTGGLLADLATGFFTSRLSHGLEAVALAGTHAFARVVLGLAVVLAFAGVHAVAVNLGISRHGVGGDTGKHRGSGQSESGTGSSGLDRHLYILGKRQGVSAGRLFSPDIALERAAPTALQRCKNKFNDRPEA